MPPGMTHVPVRSRSPAPRSNSGWFRNEGRALRNRSEWNSRHSMGLDSHRLGARCLVAAPAPRFACSAGAFEAMVSFARRQRAMRQCTTAEQRKSVTRFGKEAAACVYHIPYPPMIYWTTKICVKKTTGCLPCQGPKGCRPSSGNSFCRSASSYAQPILGVLLQRDPD